MSILSEGPPSSVPPRDKRRGFLGPGWIGGKVVSFSPVPLASSSGDLEDGVGGVIFIDAIVPANSLVSKLLISFSCSLDLKVLGVCRQ